MSIKASRKLTERISEERQLHPQAKLTDYYKLVFQALYGPGHLIDDKQTAAFYLDQELNAAQYFESTSIQDLSWNEIALSGIVQPHEWSGNDYCRVSLRLIKDGLLSFDEYCNAFIRSADNAIPYNVDEWLPIWSKVLLYLKKPIIDWNNEEEEFICKNITEGNPIMRHSNKYRELYHPHYRIIRKVYLERLL